MELIAILKKHRNADVIHLHSSKAGFLGRIAAKLIGLEAKVVYTPNGTSFLRRTFRALRYVYTLFWNARLTCSEEESSRVRPARPRVF